MDAEKVNDNAAFAAGRDADGVMVSRRRFARAGLSGSVVLGSLVSKPVLGAVPYHCTVSGQVSGNLSRAALAGECVKGSSTQSWIDNATWPGGLTRGALPSQNCVFTGANGNRPRGTNFNRYAPSVGVVLIPAFFNSATGTGQTQECSVILTSTANPSTMFQVLSSTSTDPKFILGRVVVTSLLNAASLGMDYPVTTHTIIAMFNATFGGGDYFPVGGTAPAWNRARVIEYLSSLYPAT